MGSLYGTEIGWAASLERIESGLPARRVLSSKYPAHFKFLQIWPSYTPSACEGLPRPVRGKMQSHMVRTSIMKYYQHVIYEVMCCEISVGHMCLTGKQSVCRSASLAFRAWPVTDGHANIVILRLAARQLRLSLSGQRACDRMNATGIALDDASDVTTH